MTAQFDGRAALGIRSSLLSKLAAFRLLPVAAALLTAGANADVAVPEPQPVAIGAVAADPSQAAPAIFEELGSGMASYYGDELAGNRTASGERFDPRGLTAAHRSLPFGSRVRVTDTRTGRSVVVRINDRGPFHGNRIIDLSEAAAREIGLVRRGSGQVQLALLSS